MPTGLLVRPAMPQSSAPKLAWLSAADSRAESLISVCSAVCSSTTFRSIVSPASAPGRWQAWLSPAGSRSSTSSRKRAPFALGISASGDFRTWAWPPIAASRIIPREHFGVTDFTDLKIQLAIAATDLVEGTAVYFTKGPLGPPLRASCAYPGLFQPVEYEGRLLVDGFVSAAVPVDGLRMMGANLIIAVFLEAERMDKPKSIVDVIGRSFSIVRLQADVGWRAKADVVITPTVHEFAWDDFARTRDIVAAGEASALEALPRIRAILQPWADRTQSSPSPSASAG